MGRDCCLLACVLPSWIGVPTLLSTSSDTRCLQWNVKVMWISRPLVHVNQKHELFNPLLFVYVKVMRLSKQCIKKIIKTNPGVPVFQFSPFAFRLSPAAQPKHSSYYTPRFHLCFRP